MRYADNTAIIAGSKTELRNVIHKLVKVETNYGMKINSEKTKVMKTSRKAKCLNII